MKTAFTFLTLFLATVTLAQEEDTISSDTIIDGLIGVDTTRAILVRERQSPAGMSIDLSVEFEFDSSKLTQQAEQQLEELQKALVDERMQSFAFEVVGHTDGKGDEEYNERLSLARAAEVRDFLSSRGVDRSRLVIDGKGEYELLYPHLPNDGRNRRVEITNLGKAKESP
jgi:outer membrane protein OmpA-like peptidoglycan-associated protein